MIATIILIFALIIAASIVLQKWAKDSKREREEESQDKNIYSEYEDEWMRIHRD